MKPRNLVFVCLVFVGASQTAFAACDQTLSVGANLPSAVTSAPNGSTICLNSGTYGKVYFTNINRSGYVTLQSASGVSAVIGMDVANSKFIRFQSLTISGADVNSCSSNVEVRDSTFTGGMLVTMRGATCPAELKLLLDGNKFGDLPGATYEGRLSVVDDEGHQPTMGLTISNNTFGPGCQSDGIQLVGGASGVVIGPGNIFDGIVQSGPVHCDMIQFYGSGVGNVITGNWFRKGSVALTHHTDAPDNTQFINNVISSVAQLQVDQSAGFVFDHNTVYDLSNYFALHSQAGGSVTARSNIILASAKVDTTGGATTISYALCQTSAMCAGSNQIIGMPTFVGGSVPTSLTGWKLATNSLGSSAGHDGRDVGAVFDGPLVVTPSAPTALVAQ